MNWRPTYTALVLAACSPSCTLNATGNLKPEVLDAAASGDAPDASVHPDGSNHPDLSQPDLSQPDTKQPDLSQPDLAQPDLAQPDQQELDLVQAETAPEAEAGCVGPDTDHDGKCDTEDPCPQDNPDDTDGDGICDSADPCPKDNPNDTDGDGICDSADPCPKDNPNDTDGDGVCNSADKCPSDNPDDSDGDGVCNSVDKCPSDNPDDSDGDGVCNSVDKCPGGSDSADQDGDGVPDYCDTCSLDGPMAPQVSLPKTHGQATISYVSINNTGKTIGVLSPGMQFDIAIHYSIKDCINQNSIHQIQVGYPNNAKFEVCAYDDVPGCYGADGQFFGHMTAPAQPGTYDIRFTDAQDWSCGHSYHNWWGGAPDDTRTIGRICVK